MLLYLPTSQLIHTNIRLLWAWLWISLRIMWITFPRKASGKSHRQFNLVQCATFKAQIDVIRYKAQTEAALVAHSAAAMRAKLFRQHKSNAPYGNICAASRIMRGYGEYLYSALILVSLAVKLAKNRRQSNAPVWAYVHKRNVCLEYAPKRVERDRAWSNSSVLSQPCIVTHTGSGQGSGITTMPHLMAISGEGKLARPILFLPFLRMFYPPSTKYAL